MIKAVCSSNEGNSYVSQAHLPGSIGNFSNHVDFLSYSGLFQRETNTKPDYHSHTYTFAYTNTFSNSFTNTKSWLYVATSTPSSGAYSVTDLFHRS